jgi:hypothetical protein
MSIPLDRLYYYIENIAKEIRGDDIIIYHFYPHGSKKIEDLHIIRHPSHIQHRLNPEIICHDQEPLDYDLYQQVIPSGGQNFKSLANPKDILPKRNIRYYLGNVHDKCLLLHSEQRSENLEKYQTDQFIPVYVWSHGLIARDWFRYAKFETFKKTPIKHFLIYNRAWSGTREYRIKFIDLLIENNLIDYCQTTFNMIEPESGLHYQAHQYKNQDWIPTHQLENYFNPTVAPATSSADFVTDDYISNEFEVVLETLFDDSRIHLTEKSLRPIACNQPFILAATYGSLEYLKSYGFQTFGSIIDESYDQVTDPYQRMQSIINTMKQITMWTASEKLSNMKKIREITQFNQQHFFSNNFFEHIVNELKTNLTTALDELESSNTCQQFLKLERELTKDPIIYQQKKLRALNNNTKQEWLTILNKIKEYRRNYKNNQG